MEMTPPSDIRIATTQAKIGLSMKNLGMIDPQDWVEGLPPDLDEAAAAGLAVAAAADLALAWPSGLALPVMGLTVAPGRACAMPPTIRRSPAVKPWVTTQFGPCMP